MRAYRYPSQRHRRKHGPQGYASPTQFGDWLRDEFVIRCVYCLEREQWVNRTGHFHGDHFLPVALRPDLKLAYDNLVYACHACNARKRAQVIPDPLQVFLRKAVTVRPDGMITTKTREARSLVEILQLNSREYRTHRRLMIRILRLAARCDPSLFAELMGFPDDVPDLASLAPPGGNTKPAGVEESHYALRRQRKLPDTY